MASQKLRAIISDDLADVADGYMAMDTLWTILLSWSKSKEPVYLSKQHVDILSDNFRRAEAALGTAQRRLKWVLNEIDQTD